MVGDSVPRPAVLCVTPSVWDAGEGKGKPTVHNILRGFQRAGYDVHIVSASNRHQPRDASIDGMRVHYFRIPVNAVAFDYDACHSFLTRVRGEGRRGPRHLKFRLWWVQFVLLGTLRALAVARAVRPRFTYGVNNPGIPPAFFVARRRGIPCFGRIMGSEIGGVAGIDLDGSRPVRASLGPWAALKLWLVRFDELLAFKLPAAALIVTDDGQIGPRTVTEWLGVPASRLWLWRNGIDKARFVDAPAKPTARRRLGLPADAKVVLWVGQLIDWKRPHVLIDAAAEVVARCPEAVFVIVGDGPERTRLEARVRRLGLGEHVRVVGFVPHADVGAYYRAADVFAAFYRRANVANTLLEALVCGLPVVTLDNGRTGTVVRHESNGLLIDPERPFDVPDALVRVLTDDRLRSRLSRGAADYADRHLETWDARIAREVRAISAVVGVESPGERRRARGEPPAR